MAETPSHYKGPGIRQPRMTSLSISHTGGAASAYPSFDSDHALSDLNSPSFAVGVTQDHDGDISFQNSANDSYLDLSSYDPVSHSDDLFPEDTTGLALSSSLPASSLSPSGQFDNLSGATSHPAQFLGLVSTVTGPWNPLNSRQGRSPSLSINPTVMVPPSTPQKARAPGISRAKSNASGQMSFEDSAYFTQQKNSQHEDEVMSDQNYTSRMYYGTSGDMSQPPGQKRLPLFTSPSQQTLLPSSQQVGQDGLTSQARLVPRDTMSISTSQVSHHSQRNSAPTQTLRNHLRPCSECNHQSRTKSEYNKHKAQHEKKFRCEYFNCERSTKGFSTSNDLDRHLKSVHHTNNRNSKDYKCFAKGCTKPDKIWPRADNFRQHLKSMHSNENQEELLRTSNAWYETERRAFRVQSEIESVDHMSQTSINELSDVKHDLTGFEQPFHGQFQDSRLGFNQRSFRHDSFLQPIPIDPLLSPAVHGPNRRIRRCSSPAPASGLQRQHVGHAVHTNNLSSQGSPMKRTLSQMGSSQPAVTQNLLLRQDPSAGYGLSAGIPWNFSNSGLNLRQGPSLNVPQPRLRGAYTTPNPALDNNRMMDFASPVSAMTEDFSSRQDELLPDLNTNVGDIAPLPLPSPLITVQPPDDDRKPILAKLGQVLENDIQEFLNAYEARADQDRSFTQEDLVKHFRLTLRSSLDTMTNGGSSCASFIGATSASAPSKPIPNNKTLFQCDYKDCKKQTTRLSELKKHKVRHQRPFGCTFDGCYKAFGSKNDWKRHEQSQHEQEDCWRCPFCPCLFYLQQKNLVNHIVETHTEYTGREEEATQIASNNSITRNFQGRLWCGFCNEIIVLEKEKRGVEAITYRFDHVADHFKDKAIQNWIQFPSNGETKAETQENARAEAFPTAKNEDDNDRGDAEARNDYVEHQTAGDQTMPSPSPSSPSSSSPSSSPQSQSEASPIQQPFPTDVGSSLSPHRQYPAAAFDPGLIPLGSGWDHETFGTTPTHQPTSLSQASVQAQKTSVQAQKTNKPPDDPNQRQTLAKHAEFVICCQCWIPYNVALSRRCSDCEHRLCNLCEVGTARQHIDLDMDM